MININLLPWRERRRKVRIKYFIVSLVLAIIVTMLMVAALLFIIAEAGRHDKLRLDYLNSVLESIHPAYQRAEQSQSEFKRDLAQYQALNNLQKQRQVAANILIDLAKRCPEEVVFSEVSLKGNTLHIIGLAHDNTDISRLIRNLEESPLFTEPSVQEIKTQDQGLTFNIQVGVSSGDGGANAQ